MARKKIITKDDITALEKELQQARKLYKDQEEVRIKDLGRIVYNYYKKQGIDDIDEIKDMYIKKMQ